MILAIDTSTPVCSVGLEAGGELFEKRSEVQGAHSEKLFLFIDELFSEHGIEAADLDVLLYCDGPGSYTGLRIGAAAIKGLLFETSVPLFTLHSLHSIAVGAFMANPESGVIHSVIDARRNHLYHQKFRVQNKLPVPESEPAVREIAEIMTKTEKGDVLAGTGIERIPVDKTRGIFTIRDNTISALNLIRYYQNPDGKTDFKKADVAGFEPFYLTMSQVNNSTV